MGKSKTPARVDRCREVSVRARVKARRPNTPADDGGENHSRPPDPVRIRVEKRSSAHQRGHETDDNHENDRACDEPQDVVLGDQNHLLFLRALPYSYFAT